jgi:hypothetical protein
MIAMDELVSFYILIDLEKLRLVIVVLINSLLIGVTKETSIHMVDVPKIC